jgi:hypothetical protein
VHQVECSAILPCAKVDGIVCSDTQILVCSTKLGSHLVICLMHDGCIKLVSSRLNDLRKSPRPHELSLSDCSNEHIFSDH